MESYIILFIYSSFLLTTVLSLNSCGIDNSPVATIYEGQANIKNYPWLGFLFYVYGNTKYTTGVVLVTRQIVLAAAAEIDRIPKLDFRATARVVLGTNCSGHTIQIRDYTYHPEFSGSSTLSALTIIQLETDKAFDIALQPICGPPSSYKDPVFYAMVPPDSCSQSTVTLHKMVYVPTDKCKSYYRRFDLDVSSMWPTNTVCASSMSGGKCIWRSGAILTVKTGNRWRLLGFGIYGPGCAAPARFLDYTQYSEWVKQSVAMIGTPAITELAPNHIIMRRMNSHIQRFGVCDYEEVVHEMYYDEFNTKMSNQEQGRLVKTVYNLTLVANVEYSCITLKVFKDELPVGFTKQNEPRMRLVRYCAGASAICFGFGFLSIDFSVNIWFSDSMKFKMRVYGKIAKAIDPLRVYKRYNSYHRIEIPSFAVLKQNLTKSRYKKPRWW